MKKTLLILLLSIFKLPLTFATSVPMDEVDTDCWPTLVPYLDDPSLLNTRSTSRQIKVLVDQYIKVQAQQSLGAMDPYSRHLLNFAYHTFQESLCQLVHEQMTKEGVFMIRRGHPFDFYFKKYAKAQGFAKAHATELLRKPMLDVHYENLQWEDERDWTVYDSNPSINQGDFESKLSQKIAQFRPLYARFNEFDPAKEYPPTTRMLYGFRDFLPVGSTYRLYKYLEAHPEQFALLIDSNNIELFHPFPFEGKLIKLFVISSLGEQLIKENFMSARNFVPYTSLQFPFRIQKIENGFMARSTIRGACHIQLPQYCNAIADDFCSRTDFHDKFILQLPREITTIGANFMANATTLPKGLTLDCQNIESIGAGFMLSCFLPKGMNFEFSSKLQSIGRDFLRRAFLPEGFKLSIPANVIIEKKFLKAVAIPSISKLVGFEGFEAHKTENYYRLLKPVVIMVVAKGDDAYPVLPPRIARSRHSIH